MRRRDVGYFRKIRAQMREVMGDGDWTAEEIQLLMAHGTGRYIPKSNLSMARNMPIDKAEDTGFRRGQKRITRTVVTKDGDEIEREVIVPSYAVVSERALQDTRTMDRHRRENREKMRRRTAELEVAHGSGMATEAVAGDIEDGKLIIATFDNIERRHLAELAKRDAEVRAAEAEAAAAALVAENERLRRMLAESTGRAE